MPRNLVFSRCACLPCILSVPMSARHENSLAPACGAEGVSPRANSVEASRYTFDGTAVSLLTRLKTAVRVPQANQSNRRSCLSWPVQCCKPRGPAIQIGLRRAGRQFSSTPDVLRRFRPFSGDGLERRVLDAAGELADCNRENSQRCHSHL